MGSKYSTSTTDGRLIRADDAVRRSRSRKAHRWCCPGPDRDPTPAPALVFRSSKVSGGRETPPSVQIVSPEPAQRSDVVEPNTTRPSQLRAPTRQIVPPRFAGRLLKVGGISGARRQRRHLGEHPGDRAWNRPCRAGGCQPASRRIVEGGSRRTIPASSLRKPRGRSPPLLGAGQPGGLASQLVGLGFA
jgi:hypothetical protein